MFLPYSLSYIYEIINSVVLFFSYLLFFFLYIQSNQRFLAEVLLLRFFKIFLPRFCKKNQCAGIWIELFYVFFVVLIIVILLLLLLLLLNSLKFLQYLQFHPVLNTAYLCTCFFTDIDECNGNGNNCHSNAKCTNTDGSYTCTCIAGYSGNGISCNGVCLI